MDHKKKTIVTLWIGTTVLLALFFFLPDRASNYFLSLRVFNHEKAAVQAQAADKKDLLQFFRSDKDDAQMLKMLEVRARDDGKWLIVYLGVIILALNTMACFLYVFNMRPVIMAAWIAGYFFITMVLVLQSYIRINP